MSFTRDWFSHNIPNWENYLSELKDKPRQQFLEIGCFEGMATKWLLDNILSKDSTITVIDTFEGSMEHKEFGIKLSYDNFVENMGKDIKRVNIYRGESQEVLRKLPINKYNFIYIDGSHQAADVLEDAILSFRLLKNGGIMIFDDYDWDQYSDELLTPKLGVDTFLNVFRGKYQLLHISNQAIIKKLV